MAISAINSANVNNVAFKAAKPASKPPVEAENNFFEENKEVLLGLSAIGLAVLGAAVLHRSGKTDKASQAAQEAVSTVAGKTPITQAMIDKMSVEEKQYLETVRRIQQVAEIEQMQKTINEVDARCAARKVNEVYTNQKVGAEVFGQAPLDGQDPDVRAWKRVHEAMMRGQKIDPKDLVSYAKIEGMDLSDLAK